MSKQRKSFIVHFDSLNVLDDLTNEQAGLLFKAIKGYQLGDDLELDALTKVAFSPFKNQFARDAEKYENLCEKNRLIAINRHATKSTTGALGNQTLPSATKSTDNDSKSKSDSDSKNDSKSKEISVTSRFTPPTDIETVSYFELKGSTNIEAEKFWLFYDSKNWMVGKSKMKKWESAASGWITRNKQDDNKKDILQASADSDWHLQDQGF
tara:strand:- start:720 stop:1349 length:630 start_codon:yes stop_codon:yes gene_type:complete